MRVVVESRGRDIAVSGGTRVYVADAVASGRGWGRRVSACSGQCVCVFDGHDAMDTMLDCEMCVDESVDRDQLVERVF